VSFAFRCLVLHLRAWFACSGEQEKLEITQTSRFPPGRKRERDRGKAHEEQRDASKKSAIARLFFFLSSLLSLSRVRALSPHQLARAAIDHQEGRTLNSATCSSVRLAILKVRRRERKRRRSMVEFFFSL